VVVVAQLRDWRSNDFLDATPKGRNADAGIQSFVSGLFVARPRFIAEEET
jgi:hypothetical protein